jgi:hypothetical protein
MATVEIPRNFAQQLLKLVKSVPNIVMSNTTCGGLTGTTLRPNNVAVKGWMKVMTDVIK